MSHRACRSVPELDWESFKSVFHHEISDQVRDDEIRTSFPASLRSQ